MTTPKQIETKLASNCAKRNKLRGELASNRAELEQLVEEGREAGVPMTKMAELAGVERGTLYQALLRRQARNGRP